MKRYFLCIAVFLPLISHAQTEQQVFSYMNDAYTWARNDYYGTARTIGMGNAVTAVGGDIGSIAFNPAGSVVSAFSQVSLSPGISISATSSSGARTGNPYDSNIYMGDARGRVNTKFIFPNGGITLAFNTGNSHGLKRFSFGFVANSKNFYNDGINAGGISPAGGSSFAGSMAYLQSITPDTPNNWGDLLELANANDIGIYSGRPDAPEGLSTGFIGVTEDCADERTFTDVPLQQNLSFAKAGYKMDYIINVGFDVDDIIYFGANLGIATLNYSMVKSYGERACDMSEANFWAFERLNWDYSYRCSGTGVYGKFGIIATPVAGLRLGATIQTPTRYNLYEEYTNAMVNTYGGGFTPSGSRSRSRSDRYYLITPMVFSFGAAYTFGTKGLISADYEVSNLSSTKYRAYYSDAISYFDIVSKQIEGNGTYDCGNLCPSHMLRVGGEYKPFEELVVRAGYNLTTCGSRFYDRFGNLLQPLAHGISIGAGYDSPGSFFCDLAAKVTLRPNETLKVYEDYSPERDAGSTDRSKITVGGPVIESTRSLYSIVATIGWRF